MVMMESTDTGGTRTNGWAIAEGILLVILGFVAIATPLVTSSLFALLLPLVLIIAGIVQLVTAFRGPTVGRVIWHVILGIVAIVAGIAVFAQPQIAIVSLPVLIIAWLIVDGFVRLGAAIAAPSGTQGRGWMTASGIIALLLAALLWAAPLGQTLVLIGLFIGIDILFAGITLLTVGWASGHRMAAV